MSQYPNYAQSTTAWIGQIPSHWKQSSLKHVIEHLVAGGTPSTSDDSFWANGDEGTPWVSIGDMSRRDVVTETTKRLTDAGLKDRRLTPLEAGTVIYSIYASVGFAAILELPAVTNQAILGLCHDDGVNSKYLRAYLNAMRPHVLREASSNTQDNLNSEKVKNLPFVLPPMDEQIAIAAYLDAETKRIDELINEKGNLLKLLIELRGGIIRELTAGIHLKSAMQETGNVFMPVIPSDWDMSGIGRFSNLGNGSTPLKDNADYWDGGTYPWLNSSVVNQDEVTEGSELVTENALKQCHLPIVPSGSVLVALTGQGKTRGQATMLRIEATINQHLAYIHTDGERLDGEYLFWVLSGQFNALRMISDGQGGTKGALTCDDLRKFQIPLPPLETQKKIAARLYEDTRRVDELVEYAKKEITVLAELRSSTITDAVLGRIDVRKSQTH